MYKTMLLRRACQNTEIKKNLIQENERKVKINKSEIC